MLSALWMAAATAGPTGHYHPDEIAMASERFLSASERLQQPFQAQSRAAQSGASALRQLEAALDLLGERAPASEVERYDALKHDYNRQFAVLQQFADEVVSDFDDAFTAGMERAIVEWGGEAIECRSEIASGPRVPGMSVRTQPNPDCAGEALSAQLATVLDGDTSLGAQVDAILSRTWPEVTLPSEPQAPIGAGDRWVSVLDLMTAGARDALLQIDNVDDQARVSLEARIEQGASTEELKTLTAEADRISAQTTESRQALAAPVLAVAEVLLQKWASKGDPTTAWCANPSAFGGCSGTDASRELVGRLIDDKKLAKVFPDR